MHPADDKPKHKPNPKHTLEEILKSLQDLIRNDLLEGETPPETGTPAARTTASASAAPIGPRRGPRATDGAIADSPGGELEELRHSLESLVTGELTAEDARAAESPAPEAIASEASTALDDTDTSSAPPVSDEPVTGHADATLAFDAAAPPTAELTSPTREPSAPLPGETIDEPAADGEPVEAVDRHEPEQPVDSRVPETAGDWDDIPVLDEVVAEMAAEYEPGEHEPPAAGETAAETPPPANLALPLPAPSRAHDLAVRTVAKLNIELRKAGKRPLDAKVIARLAMMLRETLESDAAKVENKPHE
jgi:hypothetical protein